MAKNSIKYNCGCGVKADNYLEASIHVDTTGHKMEVRGEVYPDKKKEE